MGGIVGGVTVKPVLGHYDIGMVTDNVEWSVRVVPVPESHAVLLAVISRGGGTSAAVRLSPAHARRLATGLIVSAEQIDYPNAVLARDRDG